MSRAERWAWHGLVALGAGSIACSGGGEASGAAPRRRDGERVVPVAVAAVERRELARSVTVAGPVEPVRTIGVNAQMSGTVLAVRVEEGARVGAGALLAELDARETAAQLARARAVLASAEATFERNRQLHANQIVTDEEFEQSRSAYNVAKSEVELWETRFAFSRIRAPSAGVVTAKHVEAGSAVSPNQRMFELADLSLLVVRVQLSELDVVHLARAAEVEVRLDAYPEARVPGTVRRVFPAADPQSRLVPVEVALGPAPPRAEVRPGYLARVTFALDRRAGALVVPAAAVGVLEAGEFVYVVQGDSVLRRAVEVGMTAGGLVEVTAGLAPGERVVTSGHTSLRPGARVRVSGGEARAEGSS